MLPINHYVEDIPDQVKPTYQQVKDALRNHLSLMVGKEIGRGLYLVDWYIDEVKGCKFYITCEFTYNEEYPHNSFLVQDTEIIVKL